jgi:hypothetical protein
MRLCAKASVTCQKNGRLCQEKRCIVDRNNIKKALRTEIMIRLRHYATSRKVVGSIPDEVIGFFS